MMRGRLLMFLAALCLFLLVFSAGWMNQQARMLEQELEELKSELRGQELQLEMSRELLNEVIRLRAENEELISRMSEWLDEWKVGEFEATAYTLECGYPWDDGLTYLETKAIADYTIAVDPNIVSLGSDAFIVGLGWRKADDIGAAIKGQVVDLYMGAGPEARALAMRWGNKTVKVVYQK